MIVQTHPTGNSSCTARITLPATRTDTDSQTRSIYLMCLLPGACPASSQQALGFGLSNSTRSVGVHEDILRLEVSMGHAVPELKEAMSFRF